MLDGDANVAVHDGLGEPGCAGGVQHVDRRLVTDRCEAVVTRLADERGPLVGTGAEVLHANGGADRREVLEDLGDLEATVDLFRAVPVAVDMEEHGGFELCEAVDHGPWPELGCATGPHGAECGSGEERHEGLDDVRRVRPNSVRSGYSDRLEAGRAARHLVLQLGPGERAG